MSGHRKWADLKAEAFARMTPQEREKFERELAVLKAMQLTQQCQVCAIEGPDNDICVDCSSSEGQSK